MVAICHKDYTCISNEKCVNYNKLGVQFNNKVNWLDLIYFIYTKANSKIY